jgi:hypothetical protein
MNRVTKIVLLTMLFFFPYYLWIAANIDRMTKDPWRSKVGLIYMPSAIVILVFIHKALYRRELAESMRDVQVSGPLPEIVWISSVDHLRRFGALPWYSKWFGFLPAGFPKIKAGVLFSPLVYFAQVRIKITRDLLTCEAIDPDSGFYENLSSSLRLNLTPGQLSNVSRFDMRQVLPTALPLPFIHIQTTSGEWKDLLICAGS